MLIDELDLLWTKKQDVLYEIFDWPAHSNALLTILAIANTMDLPERAMIHRVSSRMGMARLSFQCYTFTQLQEIICSRLEGLEGVDGNAIQLVARKVAAVSGDARRALEVCRRAAEVAAENNSKKETKSRKTGRNRSQIVIEDQQLSISHVNEALKRMTSANYIQAVVNCSKYEQLFLQSCVTEFHRTGVEDTTLKCVAANIEGFCYQEGLDEPTESQIADICERLAIMRLIVCAVAYKRGWHRSLRLNIMPEDIELALNRD